MGPLAPSHIMSIESGNSMLRGPPKAAEAPSIAAVDVKPGNNLPPLHPPMDLAVRSDLRKRNTTAIQWLGVKAWNVPYEASSFITTPKSNSMDASAVDSVTAVLPEHLTP